jgi:hypothetical protein
MKNIRAKVLIATTSVVFLASTIPAYAGHGNAVGAGLSEIIAEYP